ncbi:hypothetical protein [Hymenobacter cellulosilyticus]|uniref:Uncharacterized protein n=1 Tax=Hymenobacter cellulosilyticus TaxID=2932248 RepID=A0A8T9Q3T0_9BACT|nr:hypothetical protein [Hymenobacter cellulosilyticus]UOQ70119.1 hypothetical protein MUN79_15230 [Hymenobacter cellulosilyticus]
MKLFSSVLLAGTLSLAATPAATAQHNSSSPYHTRFAVDAPVIGGLGPSAGLACTGCSKKKV